MLEVEAFHYGMLVFSTTLINSPRRKPYELSRQAAAHHKSKWFWC
jgi:hypothetical protein